MKKLILLLTLLSTFQVFGATGISSGGSGGSSPVTYFDFGVFVTPVANTDVSGTFKTLYFDCDGVGQSTAKYNGEPYRVPAGRTYTPYGVIAFGSGIATQFKIGYHTGGVQDGLAFGSGGGEKFPDSGIVALDYDFMLTASDLEVKHPLVGPHWVFPQNTRPICYNAAGSAPIMKMYGTEQ